MHNTNRSGIRLYRSRILGLIQMLSTGSNVPGQSPECLYLLGTEQFIEPWSEWIPRVTNMLFVQIARIDHLSQVH